MGKSDFAKDCLKAHNNFRKLHGVPKLKLSSDLSKHAQKWAEHLVAVGTLSHNDALYKGDRVGENVAMKWSSVDQDYKGEEFVQQWYSEVKDYDFTSTNPTLKTGHFSQVVWKSSAELGVGMAKKNGRCIVVANYKPAGNFVGHYKDNVFPPSKAAAGSARDDSSSNSGSGSDSDDGKGGKASKHKGGSGGSSEASRPSSSGAFVGARSEKVHTTTSTTTSSTGVVKKTTTTTKTITYADGTVKTETEERTEEIPPGGGSADIRGAQSRLADLRLGAASATTRPGSGSGSGSASAGAQKAETAQQFAENALRAHNAYRKKHGAAPLVIAKDLAEHAQKWAEHLAKIGSMQHSDAKLKGETIGENVASKWSSGAADYTGQEVTDQWYSEESKYDYSGRSNAGASGHFTQVVWKGSRELGIGKASNGKGNVYVVANYRPAGNYLGQFKDNVSRP